MSVLGRMAYLFALLALGVAARQGGVLDERRTARLNDVAFYVALPALVFASTYDRPLGEFVSPTLVVGLWAVFAGMVALAWIVHRRRAPAARRSVAVVQSYHANLGYLGLPLVAATFGGAAAATGSVILGVASLTQVPLTLVLLVRLNDADADLRTELRRLAGNPVLLALAAGIAFSSLGLGLPAPVAGALGWADAVTLPLALLLVGASLELDLPAVDLGATGSVVALKLVAMPALAWATFSALSVPPATFTAAVVMLGMPSAVSSFVYAAELDGDAGFASLNVFATTVAALGTLLVLLRVVG